MTKFCFLILFLHNLVFALPVGNPGEMALLSEGAHSSFFKCDFPFTLRIGYSYDYVFDRKLRVFNNGRGDNTINRTRIRTDAVLMTLNFAKRVELFSRLGVSTLDMRTSPRSLFTVQTLSSSFQSFDFASQFSWNVGVKAILLKLRNCMVGVEAQYFETNPFLMSAYADSQMFLYPESRFREREFQIAAILSRCIKFCDFAWIPFVGVKGSRVIATFRNNPLPGGGRTLIPRFQNIESLGWVIGLTWITCNQVSLTLEGRFRDEKAFHLNGQLRF